MVNVDKDGDKIFNKYYCQKKKNHQHILLAFFLKVSCLLFFIVQMPSLNCQLVFIVPVPAFT